MAVAPPDPHAHVQTLWQAAESALHQSSFVLSPYHGCSRNSPGTTQPHQIHSLATQTCWPPSTCSPGCLDVLGHELLQKLCATGNSGRRTLLRCHTISPLLPLPPSALPVRGCSQCSAFPNFAATLLRWGQCQKYTSLRGASATAAAGLDSASRTTLSLLSTWCRSAVNSEM